MSLRKPVLASLLPMLVIITSFLSEWLTLAIWCHSSSSCGPDTVLDLLFFAVLAVGSDGTASLFSFGLGFIAYWALRESDTFERCLRVLFLRAIALLLVQVGLTITLGKQWSYLDASTLLPFWFASTCCTMLWILPFHRYDPLLAEETTQRLTWGKAASILAGIATTSFLLWCIKSWMGITVSTQESPSAAHWIREATVFETIEYALHHPTGTVLPIVFCYLSLIAGGMSIAALYPPADRAEAGWAIACGVGCVAVPLLANTAGLYASVSVRLIGAGILVGWLVAIWAGSILHRVRWRRLFR